MGTRAHAQLKAHDEESGYLLIDVGSGSSRAALFSPEHGLVSQRKESFPLGARVDAEGLIRTLQGVVAHLMRDHPRFSIRCVGVTSLLGWVAVDAAGTPVCEAWTWAHQETGMMEELGPKLKGSVARRIGRRVSPELAALKLLALKHDDRGAYGRIRRFVSLKDYINLRLTGVCRIDPIHAAYTGLFAVPECRWEETIAEEFGLDLSKMAPVSETRAVVGGVSRSAAEEFRIPEGLPVVTGAPDGSIAALGGGGIHPGDVVDVMGTTDVVFGVTEAPVLAADPENSPRSLVNNPHPLEGRWLVGGPMGMTGGTIDWFADQLLGFGREGEDLGDVYSAVERLAGEMPPGSGGVLFVPSMGGERAPRWDPHMRGTLVGLGPESGPGQVFRALVEGTAFGVRGLMEELWRSGYRSRRLICLGGGARSTLMLRVRASVIGEEVQVPENLEASSLGVAILCGLATGDFATPEQAVERTVKIDRSVVPKWADVEVYGSLFRRYSRLVLHMTDFYAPTDGTADSAGSTTLPGGPVGSEEEVENLADRKGSDAATERSTRTGR